MEKKIFKTYRAEVKDFDMKGGTVELLIPVSTPSVDRDNESIAAEAWKKTLPAFMKRPVLVSSHNYFDLTAQIGEFEKLKATGEGLMALPKYYVGEGNQEADWGFNLASKGMAAFSVGFIPKKWINHEDGDRKTGKPFRTYTEVELLEVSQVVVPSNRDAIQGLKAKGVKDPVVKELLDDIETTDFEDMPVDAVEGEDKAEKKLEIESKIAETEAEAKVEVKPKEKVEIKVSQEEIRDDIAYLIGSIEKEGISEKTAPEAWKLVNSILRLAGGDIPVDIKAYFKADLVDEHILGFKSVLAVLDKVISQIEVPEKKATPTVPKINDDDLVMKIAETTTKAIDSYMNRLRGKVD